MILLRRHGIICYRRQVRTILNSAFKFSKKDDSSSDSDNGKRSKEDGQRSKEDEKLSKEDGKGSKGETANRLNYLLKLMIEEESKVSEKVQQLELPKPKPSLLRKKELKKKEKSYEETLSDAAKDVAGSLGDTTGKTELELLNKLLGYTSAASDKETPKPASDKETPKPSSDKETPEPASDGIDITPKPGLNLSDVLTGMKVEQTVPQPQLSRAEQVRQTLKQTRPRTLPQSTDEPLSESQKMRRRQHQQTKRTGLKVDLFGAEPFTYFKDLKPIDPPCKMETWHNCMQRELRLALTHPPTNIYEQMIQWTDKGVFWQFPIDNEQGLEEERKVYFAEHIFLEQHLEGWCPEKGPVRHFMELVCVGLSKNHWLTVQEKKQHIMWYRDFFLDKKMLLKEIGAGTIGDGTTEMETNESKI